ncbi:MAG: hypothetical protein ACI9MB_001083 [Verrucomicrobiales bacterium]|jgi:hypothetical protein
MKYCMCLILTLFFGGSAFSQSYAEKMVLATFKIFNEKSTATGFVLEVEGGRQFLVSAAHVFEKMKGDKAVLVSRKKKDGGYERKELGIAVRDGEKPLWVKHLDHDVAVLELDLPEDSGVQALPLSVLASDEVARASGYTVGTDVLVLSYPTRVEANGAGFPIARRGGVASFPVLPMAENSLMMVDFTTFEGDSGGPVFIRQAGEGDEMPLVLGLVIAQFRHTEMLETFTGSQTINHPLGLSSVVQALAIREVVQKATLSKEEEAK